MRARACRDIRLAMNKSVLSASSCSDRPSGNRHVTSTPILVSLGISHKEGHLGCVSALQPSNSQPRVQQETAKRAQTSCCPIYIYALLIKWLVVLPC